MHSNLFLLWGKKIERHKKQCILINVHTECIKLAVEKLIECQLKF